MTFNTHAALLALHLMCIAGLVGGTLSAVVMRLLMRSADDSARRVTAVLLRELGLRVQLPMLLGAFATGAGLLLVGGFPGNRVGFGIKLALVILASGLAHVDSLRIKRATTTKPDPATLAELLSPGFQQATLLAALAAIALTVLLVAAR